MMKLAVASGKGGTGKTTLAVNMAAVANAPVTLVDCDVEEPNCHLFLRPRVAATSVVSVSVPEVDEAKCDACGECARFCRFNAIVSLKTRPLVFPELCHGCGGCALVCPQQAIREVPHRVGVVEVGQAGAVTLVTGRLDVGVATAPPVVRAAIAAAGDGALIIVDAPPGTSCPVIAAVRDCDYLVLVTEPTPFGLHDLALAVEMARALSLPFGVVVNRAGMGDGRVEAYCAGEGIEVLASIPEDRQVAESYSRGELLVDALPGYRTVFEQLLAVVRDRARGAALAGARQ